MYADGYYNFWLLKLALHKFLNKFNGFTIIFPYCFNIGKLLVHKSVTSQSNKISKQ